MLRPSDTRQTILNDFLTIKNKYKVTIESKKFKRTTFYRYKRRDFTIFKPQIYFEDYNHLKEALQVLTRFKGMPQFDWIDELAPESLKRKIKARIEENLKNYE